MPPRCVLATPAIRRCVQGTIVLHAVRQLCLCTAHLQCCFPSQLAMSTATGRPENSAHCASAAGVQVMVVPYCTSLSTEPETNPAMALAEVQSHLPGIRCVHNDTMSACIRLRNLFSDTGSSQHGTCAWPNAQPLHRACHTISMERGLHVQSSPAALCSHPAALRPHPACRCMMGDTIAMDQLLTEFIEGQVRIVEGQRSAVPERCFEPVQRPVSQAATSSDSLHTGSGSPWADEWQGGSSAAAAAAQQQQTVWSDAAAAAQEQAVPSSGGASSSGGSVGPSAWSDDMASVLVVDYREPSESSEAAAGSSAAAAPAAAEAARAEAVQAAPAPAEPPAWQRSGIVGSSFDMGDASSSSSSGEDDWSSQLSALSGRSGHSSQRSGSDSDSEGRGNGSGNGSAQGGNGSVEAGFGFDEQGAFVETHSRARGEQLQYDAALERRLCRMEQQLQHITTLLEAQPPAQQAQHAQQAQQAPAWQSAMFEPQQVRQVWLWWVGRWVVGLSVQAIYGHMIAACRFECQHGSCLLTAVAAV